MAVTHAQQQLLFGNVDTTHIVNVASVAHRSPFRYPGGKTWLVPYITEWLLKKEKLPATFIEPFAGGAIVGLSVAFQKLAGQIILVELDDQVGAVWQTIIYGDFQWLANRIQTFDLTAENINLTLANDNPTLAEKAFQTILRNRINRGGILAPGAGRVKNGEAGKGLYSRWYPETLAKRILDIGKIRSKITFIQGDGFDVLEKHGHDPDTAFLIDPPYTADGKKAGSRLYTHFNLDHERLFKVAANLKGDFIMTYDNAPRVQQMADRHKLSTKLISMKNTHHAEMKELLIGRKINP